MTLHGVLVRVAGTGLLITGPPASGKSRLGLELISRGHALVADDLVEVAVENGSPIGRPGAALAGFLAVRAGGVFNIVKLFGATAVAESSRIDLVLEPGEGAEPYGPELPKQDIAGCAVPLMRTPELTRAAILVEATCRNLALRRGGYDAAADLAARQAALLRDHG